MTETGSFSLENKVWRLNEVACCDTPKTEPGKER